ncbi:exo-alpha-sialidase [Wenzhouxiangella sp. AB-CW3]|uniref:sialidase family protein n=1 Tax=Wenzhouxiangella sp. AB-CW3 TaxID=2771012 RepID=UPI00168BB2D7|nr:sialidase family protein [Wenzhouxiangella sp. AB-CW3]QOC21525.1 exo-alpha-sialidase [Wenzhouxiangella sp. AB-CW3]
MPRIPILLSVLLLAAATNAEIEYIELPAGSGSMAPHLATLEDGQAVLTWLEPEGDGHAFRFSVIDGGAVSDPITIAHGEDWFANWADTPGLFVLPNGDWMAHWLAKSGPATFAYDVMFARSTDQGASWSEPAVPHRDGTQTEHGFVSYFAWDEATAGMVWLDGRYTAEAGDGGHGDHHHGHGGDMTLRTARIGPGDAIEDKQMLDERVCDCCQTASAMTARGPLVIYRGRSDEEIRDIWAVGHDGESWSSPRLLHEDGWMIGGCPVNGPALIANGENVAAAWFTMPDGVPQVRVAVSHDAGRDFSEPVALGTDEALGRVALDWHGDGFVLAWIREKDGGAELVLTRFDGAGNQQETREVVGLDGGRVSGFPALVVLNDQRLLLAWTTPGEDRRPRVRAGLVAWND